MPIRCFLYCSILILTIFSVNFANAAPAKNVILFIGDGMGIEQVKAAGMYANGEPNTLSFEAFTHKALVTTYSANSSVTDSAAAATAIATGHKGGGMPADAEPTVVIQQMAATFNLSDVKNTRKEYARKMFFEYTHCVDGIPIVGDNRGDSILVGLAGDEVFSFKRHWRDIIGPTGRRQEVISARDALDVAVENIPKVILIPPGADYEITGIRLFYYGLPSKQEQQQLTPAWGFRVGRSGGMWVYVDAFTGEFLK